jgi:pimeloyl-ACP methyl ester carboxylesterase
MNISRIARRPRSRVIAAAAAAAVAAAGLLAVGLQPSSARAAVAGPAGSQWTAGTRPVIVLEHGAWADASSWNGVITDLQRAGFTVYAPPNPLRGLSSDADYLRDFLTENPALLGKPVVLAGHSYGGAVITNATAPNIKALVYVAAFAPDQGESAFDLVAKNPGSLLGPKTLLSRPFTNPDGTAGADEYIKPASFRSVFAQDLPAPVAAQMAATQRPMTAAALVEKSGAPAWKTHPDWYMVAKDDHAIPPATERFMAGRMKAHTVEVAASHAVLVSQPAKVTDLILQAAKAR